MDSPTDRSIDALAGEILGAPIDVDGPGLATRVRGTLVDETLRTFLVRLPSGRTVRVPKTGARGTIVLGGVEIPLNGDPLRVRPEDRTKRLSLRHPRGELR